MTGVTVDVKTFMKNVNPSPKSHASEKLKIYKSEILELRKNGYSWENIKKFLAVNGITVTATTLSRNVHKWQEEK